MPQSPVTSPLRPSSAEASLPAPCVPRCPCRRGPRRPRRSPARSRRRSRSISSLALAARPRPEQLRHLRLALPLCVVQGRLAVLRAQARRGDERTHDALSRRDERSEGRRRGHPTPARTPSRVAHTRERSTHAATLTLSLIVGSAPRSSRRRVTSRCPLMLEEWRGVLPIKLSLAFRSAPLSSSSRVTSRCPLWLE